jgi:hypothetical protein
VPHHTDPMGEPSNPLRHYVFKSPQRAHSFDGRDYPDGFDPVRYGLESGESKKQNTMKL